jgi:hypothetical protein
MFGGRLALCLTKGYVLDFHLMVDGDKTAGMDKILARLVRAGLADALAGKFVAGNGVCRWQWRCHARV